MSSPRFPAKGGGPKTLSGKMRASRNSRKHGLFASKFSFSPTDEAEFDKLNTGLREVLRPNNSLLALIFEDVVACAWRMRVAYRFEQVELLKQLSRGDNESHAGSQGTDPSYLCGLRPRRREYLSNLLDILQYSIERDGVLPAELETEVARSFGPNCWKKLNEWTPLDTTSVTVVRLEAAARERETLFAPMSCGGEDLPPNEKMKCRKEYSLLQLELIMKLIDVYRDMIRELSDPVVGIGATALGADVGRLDLSIRYLTTARRDFYRVLNEYQEAKNLT